MISTTYLKHESKPAFFVWPPSRLSINGETGKNGENGRKRRGAALPERRLVEAPELARVQRAQLAAQQVDRLEADAQVLAHRALVEARGGAGQLDLAVQRLVGDAQQGAVGHAQAIALRRQRGALHVDGDAAAEAAAAALLA